jgi:hypothetical protein
MLTSEQKSSLKNLVNSPQWQIVVYLAEEYIRRIQNQPVIMDSEWETAKQTIGKEKQVEGIRGLIQEIFNSIN